jgi:hypothetical protein
MEGSKGEKENAIYSGIRQGSKDTSKCFSPPLPRLGQREL